MGKQYIPSKAYRASGKLRLVVFLFLFFFLVFIFSVLGSGSEKKYPWWKKAADGIFVGFLFCSCSECMGRTGRIRQMIPVK